MKIWPVGCKFIIGKPIQNKLFAQFTHRHTRPRPTTIFCVTFVIQFNQREVEEGARRRAKNKKRQNNTIHILIVSAFGILIDTFWISANYLKWANTLNWPHLNCNEKFISFYLGSLTLHFWCFLCIYTHICSTRTMRVSIERNTQEFSGNTIFTLSLENCFSYQIIYHHLFTLWRQLKVINCLFWLDSSRMNVVPYVFVI